MARRSTTMRTAGGDGGDGSPQHDHEDAEHHLHNCAVALEAVVSEHAAEVAGHGAEHP